MGGGAGGAASVLSSIFSPVLSSYLLPYPLLNSNFKFKHTLLAWPKQSFP
uniref:Uncharacterized protein n=1 Tax=Anguilla anguilla TaxID=7936 RepID=A0A0E9R744_ANGAN